MPDTATTPSSSAAGLPPRAAGLPLIGSVSHIARQGMIPFLVSQWQSLGDTFRMQVGPRNLVAVVHPEGVERVLATHRENYVKGRTYDGMRLLTGDGLLTLEGEPWLKRRRLEQPAFHRESIKQLTTAMSAVTARTLERWRQRWPQGGTFEAHREMLLLTLEVVGQTLFGQSLGEESTDASGRAFSEALKLISDRSNGAFALPLAIPTPSNVRLRRPSGTSQQSVTPASAA